MKYQNVRGWAGKTSGKFLKAREDLAQQGEVLNKVPYIQGVVQTYKRAGTMNLDYRKEAS